MSDHVTYCINFCVHLPGIEEEISVRAVLTQIASKITVNSEGITFMKWYGG
jgi:hypothetical protein